jgi:single-strand DNA-binding protein
VVARDPGSKSAGPSPVNEVRLVGRLSSAPEERPLPSGDSLLAFRLVVDRKEAAIRGKQRIDVLDCVAWSGRSKRTVAGWDIGSVVEVSGELRRRFFRGASGSNASRVEIEVLSGRLIRRAASA